MSHVLRVGVYVNDLESAATAARACGLELCIGQKSHKWYGRFMGDYDGPDAAARTIDPATFGKCEHAIKVPGDARAYEIGLIKRLDGKPGYELVYDNFCGGFGLEEKAGRQLSRFKREYSAAVGIAALRRQGYAVQRRVAADGRIIVEGVSR